MFMPEWEKPLICPRAVLFVYACICIYFFLIYIIYAGLSNKAMENYLDFQISKRLFCFSSNKITSRWTHSVIIIGQVKALFHGVY